MKPISFTNHARDKIQLIGILGFPLDEEQIVDAIRSPSEVAEGYMGRSIIQSQIDDVHIIRVVYEENDEIRVITVYPARRQRYGG